VQQLGSKAQTLSQHDASSHPGSGCTTTQLPVASLQTGFAAQNVPAAATHDASHVTPQQNGSLLQTELQQVAEEHPGKA